MQFMLCEKMIENMYKKTSDKISTKVQLKKDKIKQSFDSKKDKGFLNKNYKELIYPWLIIAGIMIILPIIIIVFYSFYDTSSGNILKLTFGNYATFFSNFNLTQVLLTSFFIGIFATFFSLLFGFPIAMFLSNVSKKHSKLALVLLVTTPIWITMLIRIISMQLFLEALAPSLLGTYFAVIIGMTYTYIPFMILPLYISLENRDKTLEQASKDLGASEFTTLRKVIIPNTKASIYSGSLMVLLPSMTSITVTRYMSNGSINNIGNILENLFVTSSNYTYGAAVAVITSLFMVLILIGLKYITGQKKIKGGNNE